MLEIIDLSQDIFPGMPVFKGLPEMVITLCTSSSAGGGFALLVCRSRSGAEPARRCGPLRFSEI